MPQTSSVSFPEQFQPLLDELIPAALASARAPFPQYTGERVAPFAPGQQRAFSALDALMADPRYSRMFGQAQNMLMQNTGSPMQRVAAAPVGTREITGADITARMSPYTSEVIDASMADLNKQLERARARTSARQAGIRGRGGPGTELGEGSWTPFLELEEAGLRAGNQLSSQLRNQGFESARGQATADLERLLRSGTANQQAGLRAAEANQRGTLQSRALGRQGALDMANLAMAQRGMNMGDINAMLGIGGMQQQQQQRTLDAPYQDFLRSIPWQQNKVSNLAGVLYGNPMQTKTTEGVASPWSTAAGLGATALGAIGGTGGFGANGWLMPALRGIGSAFGYDDGGYVDDEDWEPISAFDALDYGGESDDVLFGGEGDDTLTTDYTDAPLPGDVISGAGRFGPVDLGIDDTLGALLAGPATTRPSLSSQMQTSGYTAADLQKLMEDLKPRGVGSAGFFTDPSGNVAPDNFLTRLGLGMLANSDKGPLQALGLAGIPAVNALGAQRKEALANEALRQKSAAAQLGAVGKLVAEDQKAKNLGLTTEYTTNAAGERVAAQQAWQDKRSAAQIAAQENVAGINATSREKAARIAASRDPDAVKAALSMGLKKGTPEFNDFILKAVGKDKDSAREEQIARIKNAYGVDDKVAVGIADGVLRAIVSPTTGQTEIVNLATNEIVRPNLPASQTATPEQTAQTQPDINLWNAADLGTGVWSAMKDVWARTVPQVFGADTPISQETLDARQILKLSTQNLIRSLVNNPRFPVEEMKRIRAEIDIEPGMIDSTPALRTRMVAVDRALRNRLENERRAANDLELPAEMRKAAKQAASDIGNYLAMLGVPKQGAEPAKQPSQAAVEYLKLNPGTADAFDQKFGLGAAQRHLGAQ